MPGLRFKRKLSFQLLQGDNVCRFHRGRACRGTDQYIIIGFQLSIWHKFTKLSDGHPNVGLVFFSSFLGGFHGRWRDTSIVVGSPQTEPHSTWGPCSWFLRHLTWRPKQAVQGGPTQPHSFWRTSDSWSWRASMSGERREVVLQKLPHWPVPNLLHFLVYLTLSICV